MSFVNWRSFDVRPMVGMVSVALILAVSLMAFAANRSGDEVETSSAGGLDETTELVARQVGVQVAGRQVVVPSLAAPVAEASIIAADVAVPQQIDAAPQIAELAAGGDLLAAAPATSAVPNPGANAPLAGSTVAPVRAPAPPGPSTTVAVASPETRRETTTTSTDVARTPTTSSQRAPLPTTTTSTTTTTTVAAPPVVDGRYTIEQVIFGTIAAGDGSNPNEESPMGRHEAPLFLPQGWNWAQGPSRNDQWGNLRSNQFVEWRCAVIPELGHTPRVPFRINVRNGAYYQFANGSWNEAFSVDLDSNDHGAYLGQPGQVNQDPFGSGGAGRIEWRQEADGSFSAPWNPDALFMHFWAGRRQAPASGQTAEFLTSELRLQQPDGQQVDLSQVRVLFQCGIDYYNSTGGQGTQVPGPGIATYQLASPTWTPGLWVTLPGDVPAASTADFRTWLEANLPPDVRP